MAKMNKMGYKPKVGKKNLEGKPKIPVKRFFTKEGVHPFDKVEWLKRDAFMKKGPDNVFEQKGVEFPNFWSRNAVNIVAAKYFYGKIGSPDREYSLKQLIGRVVKKIRGWGEEFGYFENENQAQVFEDELTHLILHQKGSFNSPVWFNVGTIEPPQCSACFILSVEDQMEDILDWIKNEGLIFKGGSGAGANLSSLRSKNERLSGGGYASGPVSFMRGADSVAGMIKSGGTTRRAAKMVILDIDHPDIMDFVRTKADEEKKIKALMNAGYNMQDLNDDAWHSVQYQNANNSVRVTDDFMRAVENEEEWKTKYRYSDEDDAPTYDAKTLLREIAKAAWESGDPGIQFDTIINDWHTCPNSGRINSSNPCSEFMHVDNSACNLASINLLKFLKEDGTFAVDEFKHAVDIFILAQEIIVDGAGYPLEKIAENSSKFRQLGLGFANLGAFLMARGVPYNSPEGASLSGSISSLMAGEAYRYSSVIAKRMGAFEEYSKNEEPMLRVINKHRFASKEIKKSVVDDYLYEEAQAVWDRAYDLGSQYGFRNSQVTLLAPTGTISFMMDCDTTGIEPDFSLVKMKQLVGGGWMKIVNESVKFSLEKLGYSSEDVRNIISYVSKKGTVEGAPNFKEEHLPVFDCAMKSKNGTRAIPLEGHIRIVAAVQPFMSGAISKTFNMDHNVTVDDIVDAYKLAWKSGIKAFAVYRDGSKATQPLSSSADEETEDDKENDLKNNKKETKEVEFNSDSLVDENKRHFTFRKKLPDVRKSETHKFSIVGHEGYLTYSIYDDGRLAEIFIRIAKQGSTLAGLLDSFAISISIALQYGVPFKKLADKFIHSRFEPAGVTDNPDIRIATSIVDYIFRYLSLRFLNDEDLAGFGMSRRFYEIENKKETDSDSEKSKEENSFSEKEPEVKLVKIPSDDEDEEEEDSVISGSVCRKCGGMMIRTGTCETCLQCGESSGGCS
jgi:ribonucleoside-diphosphate reductase alpha chain